MSLVRGIGTAMACAALVMTIAFLAVLIGGGDTTTDWGGGIGVFIMLTAVITPFTSRGYGGRV